MPCRLLVLTVLSLLVIPAPGRAQYPAPGTEPPKVCNHSYNIWDAIRILPVRFTEFNGDRVQWKYRDEYIVKSGSFSLHPKAQYISRDKKPVSLVYVMQHKDSDWLCY